MNTRDPSTLTCREVVELVTDFLGDGLEPDERLTVEQHLLVCPPCTTHVAQMRATIALTADLRSTSASTQVIDLFRKWKRTSEE